MPLGNQVRDAMRDDARFPGACARKNQQRAGDVLDGSALGGIKRA
jgi:hypothetical protein